MIPAPKEEESSALGPTGVHQTELGQGLEDPWAAGMTRTAFLKGSGACATRSSVLVMNSWGSSVSRPN